MNRKRFIYAAAMVILLCLAGLAPPARADETDVGASAGPPSEAAGGPAGGPQYSGPAGMAPVCRDAQPGQPAR